MIQEERNASEILPQQMSTFPNLPNLHAIPSPRKSLTLLSPVQSFQYVQQVAKAPGAGVMVVGLMTVFRQLLQTFGSLTSV